MKIVLAMFGVAVFALVPFMEFFIRYIVLGIIFVFLLVIWQMLRKQGEKELGELKERKRKGRIYLVYFLMGVVVVTGLIQLDPMRRSENAILANVLNVTPLGIDINEAVDTINGRFRWGNIDLDENWQVPSYDRDAIQGMVLDGDTVVGTRLGIVRYFLFLRYEARAIWIFDEYGELMDVVVRKDFQPFRRADLRFPVL